MIRYDMFYLKIKKSVIAGVALAFLFAGCTNSDSVEEFNRPALYWYKQIGKSISSGNLDRADSYYLSLKSEHMRSPLMPTAMMMLAHAHMNEEEYLLANYYLDEYNKRYSGEKSRDYIDFMKLKASFFGIKEVYKDQKLILDSIEEAKRYLLRYPYSAYRPLVNTILTRVQMSQYLLNENIASLYDRIGKKRASKIYREKNRDSVVEMSDITPPKKGIIGKIFD